VAGYSRSVKEAGGVGRNALFYSCPPWLLLVPSQKTDTEGSQKFVIIVLREPVGVFFSFTSVAETVGYTKTRKKKHSPVGPAPRGVEFWCFLKADYGL